jgi:hypothetical protein
MGGAETQIKTVFFNLCTSARGHRSGAAHHLFSKNVDFSPAFFMGTFSFSRLKIQQQKQKTMP